MISTTLRSDIDRYADDLRESALLLQLARTGRLSRGAIGRYVRSIHYLLLQTPVHLELARAAAEAAGDRPLAEFFAQKRSEESGHHDWAAEDIARLEALFRTRLPAEPSPAMVELVRTTRRLIQRDSKLYLAYILFAEYLTVVLGPEWLTALESGCGIPLSAVTAIGNHVELDRHHVLDGCAEIDVLAAADDLEDLRSALAHTMRRFSAFCDDVAEAA